MRLLSEKVAAPCLAVAAVLLLAQPSAADCAPKPGLLQIVTNPRSPDADYSNVSTITFACPNFGCHRDWSATNPLARVTWEVSNDADEHRFSCTWQAIEEPDCVGNDHGWHSGHNLKSTLRAEQAPQTSEIAWFRCPRGII